MTPTEVLLRPAQPGDVEAVTAVHLASRGAASMPAGVHTDDEVRAHLAARALVDDVWVAEVADAIVGYCRLTPTWLDDLYVAPSHARTGVGSALLDLAKQQRPGGFCLWVFEVNAPARAFYARHGLIELERTDGSANDERAPDIRVAWPGADPDAFLADELSKVDAMLDELSTRRGALARAVRARRV